jgi:hypothetical protein
MRRDVGGEPDPIKYTEKQAQLEGLKREHPVLAERLK